MKKLLLIFGFIILSSCTQKTDVTALLNDTDTRSEIFTEIAGNHDLMMSFMETMQANDHAMQMMQGNQMMMGHMMKGNGMQMMMKNSAMMGNMMQMMSKEGFISNECMQAMMKIMNDRGMNIRGTEIMNQEEDKNK